MTNARAIKTREELIEAYLEFFKSKNHKVTPSASLIPENDPTVLFTTAGMHPLVPYLLGEKHPLGKRLVDVQKCIRTGDIEEVGDDFHLTFFEMLGNWSLGDYFKKEAIEYTFEFLTKKLGIPADKIAVSVFAGDKAASKDEESAKVWLSLGISKERIAYLPKENNWWEHPSNNTPCGPCTEIFYWVGKGNPKGNPKTNEKEWAEIGNNVLMEFTKISPGNYVSAKQKNIDFGGGCERILAIINKNESVYETNTFVPLIKKIEKLSGKKYSEGKNKKAMRIISDHIKASTMILGDIKTVKPSNIGQGYVLRRLIRRAIRYGKIIGIDKNFTVEIAKEIIPIYPDYPELKKNEKFIFEQLEQEENRFRQTIEQGTKEFEKICKDKKIISGKDAFLLFQSYGFPIEMTQELAKEKNIKVNIEEYTKEFEKHQELSRTASAGMFKSGLADNSEITTKLHTATHMLLEALRQVLKDKSIIQKGSNITPERIRLDFNFPRKLEEKEIKQVEEWVNDKINQKIKVIREEMPLEKALSSGAHGEFGAKYPEIVSVYTIGNFSKEICTGPHVNNTSELGHFKILKEESSSAGIRRIKAILE
jgi:alanyl-tRNA synthetase